LAGKQAEAEKLARESVVTHTRLHGAEHMETAWSYKVLGGVLLNQSKFQEALGAEKQSLAIMQKLTRDQKTVGTAETMAMALAELGRFDDAVQWQRNAIGMASQAGRPGVAAKLTANLQLYEARRPCRVPWTDDDPIHHPAPQ